MIGSGSIENLKNFREVTGFQGILLTDPSRKTFEMLGFRSGIGGLVGLQPLIQALSAVRAGFRPGSLQGNALQLGGAVVISKDGGIRYYYQSNKAGEHPSAEELLEVIS